MAAVPPDPQSPIEGLRAWLAQLDRRVGIRTYLLGAIAVLGLAASVVALVLVLQLKRDSATKDDISTLQTQVSETQDAAQQAAKRDVRSLEDRIAQLETRLDQVSSDQESIKRRLNALKAASGASGAGGHNASGTGVTGAGGVFGAPSDTTGATGPDGSNGENAGRHGGGTGGTSSGG